MLANKKILLCVTGGIAAFKIASLASKLIQEGAIVKVAMTKSATKFITPLTFQSISGNKVLLDIFDEDAADISHIELANWADIVVVAPATANTIAKIAHGIADNLITTIILATPAPIFVAPAMNCKMMENIALVRNIEILREDGLLFLDPEVGHMACGHVGNGRLLEPEAMLTIFKQFFTPEALPLTGKKFLITAGGTKEKIDPVRYFGNRSSGKMGQSLAVAAKDLGADVTLITTNRKMESPKNVQIITVESAQEMLEAVTCFFPSCDCFISAAAISDYTIEYSEHKIKKNNHELTLKLKKTEDILHIMGTGKEKQVVIGFAAETENIEENALKKLKAKNLDMIVANDILEKGAGFDVSTNKVTLFLKDKEIIKYPLLSKDEVAKKILSEVNTRFFTRKETL